MSGRSQLPFARFAPVALLTAATALVGSTAAQAPERFHLDHVLGTSLDLAVAADAPTGARFRDAVLAEVERLDAVLSGWRDDSPVARLSHGQKVSPAPTELLDLLELADSWRIRSGGAFDVRIGALAALWGEATAKSRPPEDGALAAALQTMRASGYAIDRTAATIAPSGGLVLAIDGIAKGYVLDRALAAARAHCPDVTGALLDIGGDAVAFGAAPGGRAWRVGIADPQHPAENAPPLAELELGARAIATSGGYARGYRVGDVRRSHILDPGTGQPTVTMSATVIAADAVFADALATTLCVLGPADGLTLAAGYDGVECLIVDGDGRRHASPGFAALAATRTGAASAFPGGNVLDVALTLPKIAGRRVERPYVAVWIEDGKGQHVRTLTLWGRERRWISELTKWWRAIDADQTIVDSVSRASRGPGEYRLTWDGRDALGLAVAPGEYTVAIEVAREHGGHTTSRAGIRCENAAAEATVKATAELAGATLHYGPQASDK